MKYKVILADPPWLYYGSPTKNAAAGKHYPCMSLDDLIELAPRVRDVRNIQSALFLWTTGPKLSEAAELLKAWGYHYRGVAFVWVKTRVSGEPIGAQGIPPTFTKPTTEFVIAGSTFPKGRPVKLLSSKVSQVVMAPRGRHSQKPETVQDRIDEMFGKVPKLELFARRERPGWACWGNELDNGVDF